MTRRAADLLPAAVLLAAAELEVVLEGMGAGVAVLAAIATAPFALRRRLPAAPFLAAGVVVPVLVRLTGQDWLEQANAPVFVLLAAAWALGSARLVVAVPALAACFALVAGDDAGFLALLTGLPWLCARAVRGHRERAAGLRAMAGQLADERAMGDRLGAAQERARLVRDVHDAIAHAVGAMALQAAGAEQILCSEPGRARSALAAVQETGREAIAQLRATLGILRAEDPPPPPPPPPRTAPPRPRVPAPAALAALALATAVYAATGGPLLAVAAVLAATYVAASATSPAGALMAGALGVGVPTGLALADGDAFDALLPLVITGVPWIAGRLVAGQSRRAAELTARIGRLRGERDARMRLAALEERNRIARELHDSVAHGVSVMVLQAGAAAERLERDPEQALAAVRAVQEVGRSALAELRMLVGAAASPVDPHPGLDGLPALLAAARAAGLPVALREEGDPEPLSPAVDAAAFRVVQEALTNAMRHAAAAPTTVTIRHARAGISIEVVDDGRPAGHSPGGHGLAGMRERVERHGGELRAGPREDAPGFAVRAFLPAEGVPA